MNLFRSEADAKNWAEFKGTALSGLKPLQDYMEIFSSPLMKERLSDRYISSYRELAMETVGRILALNNNDPFWKRSM